MDTPISTAQFEEYSQRERRVTLMLYGLEEANLTPEQRAALDAYMDVTYAVYLTLYGPSGPRGAHLRQETQAEASARWAFEEAIKPPEQKLKERVEALALSYCESNALHPKELTVAWVEEETNEIQLGYWLAEGGGLREHDRLFEVCLLDGWKRDHARIEIWVAVHPNDELEILQARCIAVEVNGNYYPVHSLARMEPEDREDVRSWCSV